MLSNNVLKELLVGLEQNLEWKQRDLHEAVDKVDTGNLFYLSEKIIELNAQISTVKNAMRLDSAEQYLAGIKEKRINGILQDSFNKHDIITAKAEIKIINTILEK